MDQLLEIAAAVDKEYQIRDGTEAQRAFEVLSVHLAGQPAEIEIKQNAAEQILKAIQKFVRENKIPAIEEQAKEAISALNQTDS